MAVLRGIILTSFLAVAAATSVFIEKQEMLAEIGAHAIEAKDSKMVRREVRSAPASGPSSTGGAKSSSGAYDAEIQNSNPVAYWPLNELSCGNPCLAEGYGPACGLDADPADECRVRGEVWGTVKLNASSLIPSNLQDAAMSFAGGADDTITVPDHALININISGYPERTVEFWFEAGDLGDNVNRSVFSEGQEDRAGINIYARSHVLADGNKSSRLYMYVWNRKDNENIYGTRLINFDPLECEIKEHTPYYVAFTFDAEPRKVIGYIGRPGKAVEECGRMDDLPAGAHIPHHGHDDNVALVIGGIHGKVRTTGLTHVEASTGSTHNWVGIVDDVAIYNRCLLKEELQKHVDAARR